MIKEDEQISDNVIDTYMKAQNYIKKFTTGGRYSDLWGKPSTLTSACDKRTIVLSDTLNHLIEEIYCYRIFWINNIMSVLHSA